MTRLALRKSAGLIVLLTLVLPVHACHQTDLVQTIKVSLRNTETYQYPTVGGDEEGARVVRQAQHYSVSEIRRNAATNWIATYVYRPLAGFVGSDRAEIEILTGSDGASPPTHIKRVAFDFIIQN
jgi:hypothetical protein